MRIDKDIPVKIDSRIETQSPYNLAYQPNHMQAMVIHPDLRYPVSHPKPPLRLAGLCMSPVFHPIFWS